MPNARGGLGAAIADGNLLAVGGESPTGAMGDVESYNIAREEMVERSLDAHPSSRNRGGRDRPHALRARRRAATRSRERIVDRGSAQAHALSDPTPAQNRTGPLP